MGTALPFHWNHKKLLLVLFVLNCFVQIVSATPKSKSNYESRIYINNNDKQTKQYQQNEQTIPQHYPTYARSPSRDLSARILETFKSVTNDGVLSTQKHNKNTSQKTAPHTAERVVYGTDDRKEVVSSEPNLLKLFQADVALIRTCITCRYLLVVASSTVSRNIWGNYDVISGTQTLTFAKGCGFLCSNVCTVIIHMIIFRNHFTTKQYLLTVRVFWLVIDTLLQLVTVSL